MAESSVCAHNYKLFVGGSPSRTWARFSAPLRSARAKVTQPSHRASYPDDGYLWKTRRWIDMQSDHGPEEMAEGHEVNDQADESPRQPSVFRREDGNHDVSRSPFTNDRPTDDGSGGSIATSLRNVAATLEADPAAGGGPEQACFPRQPRTLAEVGLSKAFLTDLALKIIHYSGAPSTAQLMRMVGV